MVCLTKCAPCQMGHHERCQGAQPAKGHTDSSPVFGGSICNCSCRGQRDNERKAKLVFPRGRRKKLR